VTDYIAVSSQSISGSVAKNPPLIELGSDSHLEAFASRRVKIKQAQGREAFLSTLDSGEKIFCKEYQEQGILALLRSKLYGSRAASGHQKCLDFFNTGALTASPLGYLVKRTALFSRVSYQFIAFIENSITLDKVLKEQHSAADRQPIITELVQALLKIHQHGFCHGDLKLRNILVKDTALYFIDLDSFSAIGWRKTAQTDMAWLIVGLSEAGCVNEDVDFFLRTYCQQGGLDRHVLVKKIRPLIAKFQCRHKRRHGREPIAIDMT